MKYSTEFRDRDLVEQISARMHRDFSHPAKIMEVCGTHTMSVARFGLKSLLPAGVELVSGPGCPVCVTDQRDIDLFLALGRLPGVTLASFGDMLRVPGSATSLEKLRAEGGDVRVVYSPLDAVEIAGQEPGRSVVFFGVGFETTMPASAMAITSAAELGLPNFSVFCVHKTMPAALRALFAEGSDISGLLLPGHVTTIIGADAYTFLADELGLPCAVTGFEPLDIMLGIESIMRQIETGAAVVDNVYARAVNREPNSHAAELLRAVFVACDGLWRGLGMISDSAVRIGSEYARFDARARFADVLAAVGPAAESRCGCGDVLRGVIGPHQCPFFGSGCTPEEPLGPCMVSTEGACAAAYIYGGL